MKKLLGLVVGLCAVVSLAACGDSVDPTTSVENARNIATAQMEAETSTTVDVIGVVSAIHYSAYRGALSESGCYLTDSTGTIYVYGYSLAQEVEVGDKVSVNAVTANYYGSIQLSGPTLVETISTGNKVSTDAVVTGKDLAYVTGLDSASAGVAFEVTGKVTNNEYGNYYISDDAGNSFLLYSSGTRDDEFALGYAEYTYLDEFKDKTGTFVIVVNGFSTSGSIRGHVISAK